MGQDRNSRSRHHDDRHLPDPPLHRRNAEDRLVHRRIPAVRPCLHGPRLAGIRGHHRHDKQRPGKDEDHRQRQTLGHGRRHPCNRPDSRHGSKTRLGRLINSVRRRLHPDDVADGLQGEGKTQRYRFCRRNTLLQTDAGLSEEEQIPGRRAYRPADPGSLQR